MFKLKLLSVNQSANQHGQQVVVNPIPNNHASVPISATMSASVSARDRQPNVPNNIHTHPATSQSSSLQYNINYSINQQKARSRNAAHQASSLFKNKHNKIYQTTNSNRRQDNENKNYFGPAGSQFDVSGGQHIQNSNRMNSHHNSQMTTLQNGPLNNGFGAGGVALTAHQ